MTTADVEGPAATIVEDPPEPTSTSTVTDDATTPPRRRRSPVRAVAMRPRRFLVKVHRWLSIVLLA
jgi:hypothetical protein